MNFCCYHRVLLFLLFNSDLLDAIQQALTGSTVQLICPDKAATSTVWHYVNETNLVYLAERDWVNNVLPSDLYRRLFITGNHGAGEYNLNINDTRKSDEGIYRCTATGKEYEIFLIVIVGPTEIIIENLTQDNKIHGIEGQEMTVKCTAVGGQPAPIMKLEIFGSTYSNERSVQHKFISNSSNDGSTVKCQAGYTDINYIPISKTAYIYLKLKPVITHFSPDTLSTEETKPFAVSCQSTGSRPVASMYWLLGQQATNITSNSTYQSNPEQSPDKFTVTSILNYSLDRRYNGQKLICRAGNVAGYVETSLTLNVKYAPSVKVENKTFPHYQSSREINSTLDSNPPVNNCTWHHRSKYGEHIRTFKDKNQTLKLPTVSEDKRYQDTGEYICTAENGIEGINGQLKKNGSGYVTSNAAPVITADNIDNNVQYGKFGESTKIKVNVYSIPAFSRVGWYKVNTPLEATKHVTKQEPAVVKDVFHGVEVQLDGYIVSLTISNVQETDFTNYTLRLYHSIRNVEYMVMLESASAPETPSNFTIVGSGETSITVQWIAGYNGGHAQIFYVEYRVSGTNTWISQEIKTSNQLNSRNMFALSGLQEKTSYELRMYAKNKFNQSEHTDIETIKTLKKENLGGVIGGVAGGLLAMLAILVIIVIVLFKRKKDSGIPRKRTRSHSDSEVEEGLKDNVLYEGSEQEGLKVNILNQSAGTDYINQGPNAEYAEVSKPPKKPNKPSSDEYADLQKQNDVYAEVDKKAQQKNVKNKKQKDKKKPPKSGKIKSKALNNNPDGEYANSGIPMGNMCGNAYSNDENQSAGNKKNDQGLAYADLTFGSKIPKGKQPVIHGDENRTIYSEVDHTKKAPPPPQESEYEETDIRHGKK